MSFGSTESRGCNSAEITELEEVEARAVDIAAEQRKAEKTEYKDLASPKGHNNVYDSKLNAFSRKQERAYF